MSQETWEIQKNRERKPSEDLTLSIALLALYPEPTPPLPGLCVILETKVFPWFSNFLDLDPWFWNLSLSLGGWLKCRIPASGPVATTPTLPLVVHPQCPGLSSRGLTLPVLGLQREFLVFRSCPCDSNVQAGFRITETLILTLVFSD